MRRFIISKQDENQRLDKYLKRILPGANTGFLYKMLRKKNITLNDKKAQGNEKLCCNDDIKLYFSEETFLKFSEICSADDLILNEYKSAFSNLNGISVIFEDHDVMILNKPAGVLSQKAKATDDSINEWLIGYLLSKSKIDEKSLRQFKPSICNRLDRNTSGLIVAGVSLNGSQTLSELLKKRDLHKYYLTYVCGILKESIHMKGYLYKDSVKNKVLIYNDEEEIPHINNSNVSKIETIITPVAIDETLQITKLEIQLITGKTHQIRAHLSSIGHPILGDYKYGFSKNNKGNELLNDLNFQLLHAYKMEFPQNVTRLNNLSDKIFTAPLPQLFLELEGKLCLHGIQED